RGTCPTARGPGRSPARSSRAAPRTTRSARAGWASPTASGSTGRPRTGRSGRARRRSIGGVDDAARVLVLANRTAGSPQLRDALLDRREQGPIEVTLLVPAAWEPQDPHGGQETGRRRVREALSD